MRLYQTPKSRLWICASAVLALLTAASAGCGGKDDTPITAASSKYEVDDGGARSSPAGDFDPAANEPGSSAPASNPAQAATGATTRPPSATAANSGDVQKPSTRPPVPQASPDSTPEELLAVIRQLQQRPPQGATPEQQKADFGQIQQSIIEIAERVLDSDAEPGVRGGAAEAIFFAVESLRQNGFAGADEQRDEVLARLSKDKHPEIARLGRVMLLNARLEPLTSGQEVDVQPLIADITSLAADYGDDSQIVGVLQQAIQRLEQTGRDDDARQAYEAVGAILAKNENENVARLAEIFYDRAKLIELQFSQKLEAAMQDPQQSLPPLMESITVLLQQEKPSPLVLQATLEVAQILESMHEFDAAAKVFEQAAAAFKDHPQPEVAEYAATNAVSGQKRLGLLGKPLELEGLLLSGEPFDWSQYRGKVVLVDFWATWCSPCMDELPNVKENYERYKDKGFDIVGVNMNDQNDPEQKADLERFFRLQSLPWTTIVSNDPESQGFEDPNATNCGVIGIPFMLLVDRDGKVAALHTRGDYLDEKLAEMLGPAPEEGGDPAPADNDAATDPPANSGAALQSPASHAAGPQWRFVSFADEQRDDDGAEQAAQEPAIGANPYLAGADLSPRDLVLYLFDMQEKPASIQRRPGFTAAVVDAADRILAADAGDKDRTIAAEAKFKFLHRAASLGDEDADAQLMDFVDQMRDDLRPEIAKFVQFLQLERRAIEVDSLPQEQIAGLLADLKQFAASETLTGLHLRLASNTVRAVNRLEDGDQREKYFDEFGKLFAKSGDSDLSRYGRKLAKSTGEAESDLLGKPLELAGVTVLGEAFDWSSYRGKVVLVDFWATWCGPCRRELPQLQALYQKLKDRGFDVVAISLDKDLAALGKYLEEHQTAWVNLAGDEAAELAVQYGVRGIPTMMLVDQYGKVVAVAHQTASLAVKAEELLAAEAVAQ